SANTKRLSNSEDSYDNGTGCYQGYEDELFGDILLGNDVVDNYQLCGFQCDEDVRILDAVLVQSTLLIYSQSFLTSPLVTIILPLTPSPSYTQLCLHTPHPLINVHKARSLTSSGIRGSI
ncbi:MAG: hypothetical protein EZS28_053385, partial [Streblomastix strix]